MDLFEIQQRFKSERDCEKYLESIRWPSGVECKHCSSHEVYKRNGAKGYKCRTCNSSFSVTAGTIFHSSKLPLIKWFFAISQILSAKKGISSLQLSRSIGVNPNTAWLIQFKIRTAIKTDILLKGIIEVDETYVGGFLRNVHKHLREKKIPIREE